MSPKLPNRAAVAFKAATPEVAHETKALLTNPDKVTDDMIDNTQIPN